MSDSRRDFVISELENFNKDIARKDRHAKFCKMSTNPFVFYRGTDHIYWADFAQDMRLKKFGGKKTKIWLQGDMHAYNFGSFGDDEGNLVYDLNDFDEGVIADYQLDVWRMAASLALISRDNGDSKESLEQELIETFAASYLKQLGRLCKNDNEKKACATDKNSKSPLKDFLKKVGSVSRKKARAIMLEKWTNGKWFFDFKSAKLEKVSPKERKMVREAIEGKDGKKSPYRKTLKGGLENAKDSYFTVLSVARRLGAGTGSLGTNRYYVLIGGKSKRAKDEHILDVKCQGQASAYPYLDKVDQKVYKAIENDAARTVEAYRALAVDTDDHLGWVKLEDGYYSVRERSPRKDSYPALVSELGKKDQKLSLKNKGNFKDMCHQWGKILATAHARADSDFKKHLIDYSFEKEVSKVTKGKRKEFCKLVSEIGVSYANQVEQDWAYFNGWFDAKSCKESEMG